MFITMHALYCCPGQLACSTHFSTQLHTFLFAGICRMENSMPIFYSEKINKTDFFSALIRQTPGSNRLQSNQKPKKICVHILQILQITEYAYFLPWFNQTQPLKGWKSNHRQRVIFVDATKAIVLSCLGRKLTISCHLCCQHQTLNC